MAVIGKIRSKSGLILVTVGVAMVLFVLGDLLNSGSGLFRGSNNVGEIDGEPISYQRFEAMVQEQLGTETPTEQQRQQIRDQVWNTILQEKLLIAEFDKAGISASAEEVFYELKNNPNNAVLTRYFTNPQTGQVFEQFRSQTGGLDNQKAIAYFKNLINSGQNDQWLPLEKALRTNRMVTKYNNLIKSALYATNRDVELYDNDENRMASFSYAMKLYDDISDDQISYDDSDLRDYYNRNKDKADYKQDETTRSIRYVVFNVEPTSEDVDALQQELLSLKEAYQTAPNDTDFISEYTDSQNRFQLVSRSDVPRGIDSVLFGGENGEVYGPFTFGNEIRLVKIQGRRMEADSVRARHILVPINEERDTATAQALVDSLKNVLKKGGDFGELAQKFSEDFGSATKGGDLDWFTRGRMVPPFEKASFESNVGDLVDVTTQFGIHLIEVTDRTKDREKLSLGFVTRVIAPSENTFDNVYNKASEFSINNNSYDAFVEAVEIEETLQLQQLDFIKEQDKTLGDFSSPRTVIRWVYDAEKGQVSEPFEQDNRFIVVSLENIKEEGTLEFETVKEEITLKVIREKKAELIISQMSEYQNVQEAATQLDTDVETIEALSFREYSIPGIGRDNKVLGKIFGIQPGQVSEPLKGEEGVVVIQMNEISLPETAPDYRMVRDQLSQAWGSRIDIEVYEALKEAKKVEDFRYKYY